MNMVCKWTSGAAVKEPLLYNLTYLLIDLLVNMQYSFVLILMGRVIKMPVFEFETHFPESYQSVSCQSFEQMKLSWNCVDLLIYLMNEILIPQSFILFIIVTFVNVIVIVGVMTYVTRDNASICKLLESCRF